MSDELTGHCVGAFGKSHYSNTTCRRSRVCKHRVPIGAYDLGIHTGGGPGSSVLKSSDSSSIGADAVSPHAVGRTSGSGASLTTYANPLHGLAKDTGTICGVVAKHAVSVRARALSEHTGAEAGSRDVVAKDAVPVRACALPVDAVGEPGQCGVVTANSCSVGAGSLPVDAVGE